MSILLTALFLRLMISGVAGQDVWTPPFAVLPAVSFAWSPSSFSQMSFIVQPAGASSYAAFGIALDGGMSGNSVICSSVAGSCGSYTMVNWNIAVSPVPFANLTSRTSIGGGLKVLLNFTVDLRLMMSVGVATGMDVTKDQRAVFASGQLDPISKYPQQHQQTSSYLMCVTCGTLSPVPDLTIAPWIVSLLLMLALFAALVVWKRAYPFTYLRKFWHRRLAASIPLIVIGICSIIFLALFSASYSARSATASAARAFGQLSCFYFALLLIPATRFAQLARFAGVPFDRIIWMHPILAFALISSTTLHFLLIYQEKGSASLALSGPIQVNLAGFISWIFMLVMLIFGWLRHSSWFPGAYDLFRYSHVLFLVVVIFAIVHNNILAAMMAPGLLLWVADRYLRYRHNASSKARVELLHYDPASMVISASISVAWEKAPAPCQYVFLSCSELGYISHPFTIAGYTPKEKIDNATEGQQQGSGSSGGGIITLHIRANKNAKSTWTGRLRALIEKHETHTLTEMNVSAPMGEAAISIDEVENALLIAGGIGITPILSILQHLSRVHAPQSSTQPPASRNNIRRVHLVWVVKDAALLQHISPSIDSLVHEAASLLPSTSSSSSGRNVVAVNPHCRTRISVEYYVTSNVVAAAAAHQYFPAVGVSVVGGTTVREAVEMVGMRRGDMTDFSSVSGITAAATAVVAPPSVIPGRPDIPAIFSKLFSSPSVRGEAVGVAAHESAPGREQKGEAVSWEANRSGCFTCGPVPLMDFVEAACSQHKVPLHRESFQL